MAGKKKELHAVVLVHGQGEQRPMQFGPEFVEHVLLGDFDPATASTASNPQVRWKPEEIDGLDEVRRIEVRYGKEDDRPDLDLFEFYWAPKMAGNRLSHFQIWFFSLLRRPRKDLPKRVRWMKPVVLAWIWAIFATLLFYLYLTAGALFPVQLVQITSHGWGDFFQFALDKRLAVFIVPLVMTVAAFIMLLRRRYGWCLSFCLSAALLCAAAPIVSDAQTEITDDIDRFDSDNSPPYNIWGALLDENDKAHPGSLLVGAASVSAFLCRGGVVLSESEHARREAEREKWEEAVDNAEEGKEPPPTAAVEQMLSRHYIDVYSDDRLGWSSLNHTAGGELNDLCLAPIALASPVVFARDADSGHVLATILLTFMGAIAYLLWRVRIRGFLVHIMGDSARYLNNHPDNIRARHEIRKSGVDMLARLHGAERYSRILVLAHSLGTIVAYDILRQYWGHVSSEGMTIPATRLRELREAAKGLEEGAPDALDRWQAAQGAAFDAVGATWKVSDFVTLGSPLAHGRLLLEGSPEKPHPSGKFISQRDVTRAIPACPPTDLDGDRAELESSDMFAVTQWTNLFFHDDIVGGTVAADADGPLFGPGIRDEAYSPKRLAARGLSHNSYWMSRLPPNEAMDVPWLVTLRKLVGG